MKCTFINVPVGLYNFHVIFCSQYKLDGCHVRFFNKFTVGCFHMYAAYICRTVFASLFSNVLSSFVCSRWLYYEEWAKICFTLYLFRNAIRVSWSMLEHMFFSFWLKEKQCSLWNKCLIFSIYSTCIFSISYFLRVSNFLALFSLIIFTLAVSSKSNSFDLNHLFRLLCLPYCI